MTAVRNERCRLFLDRISGRDKALSHLLRQAEGEIAYGICKAKRNRNGNHVVDPGIAASLRDNIFCAEEKPVQAESEAMGIDKSSNPNWMRLESMLPQ